MKSKKETTAQFSRLMTTQERKCRQLTTDKGTEFTSVAFNQLMVASDIRHVYKEALNDLSTIDRAMGLIKDRIGVIVAERGGTWLDVLQQVINAHNGLDTKALLDNAPEDVFEDAELRFRLRQENAEKRHENVELAIKRVDKLEAEGGFRTLLQKEGVKRRTGLPNWS